jgi:para-nitrobenzyl esterase
MPLVIDGANITGTPEQVFAAHAQNDVPVMLGITRDERFINLGPAHSVADYSAVVRAAFPGHADAVLAAYPARTDADVQRALVDLMRDASVGKQMFDWANATARYGTSPAYAYFFTRRQPYAPGITFSDHDPASVGAYHSGEVPYFLRNLDSLNLFRTTRNWSDADRELSATMSGMILSFVRGGAPAADWRRFDPAHPRMMMLGEDIRTIDWPRAGTMALLTPRRAPPVATAARPRD